MSRSSDGWADADARVPSAHPWVRELSIGDDEPDTPVCRPDTIAALVSQVGEGAAQWAIALGRRIAERTIRRFPEFGGGPGTVATLRLGTEQSAIYMVRSLDAGHLVYRTDSPESRVMARDYVQRRVPMERIWHGMRSGHAWLTEELMAACRELTDRQQSPDELEYVSQILFEFVIIFAAEVGELYGVENAEWTSSAEFTRDETIRAILDEDAIDPDYASHVLGYSLSQYHVCCIVSAPEDADLSSRRLSTVASGTLRALGANTNLVVPVSAGTVHAWGGADRRLPPAEADEIAAETATSGETIAVGLGGRGPDGFRSAFRQATRTASTIAMMHQVPTRAMTHNQLSLLGLLLENPDEALNFAERELGGLAARSPQAEALRETVLAYMECRHSPRAAAEKLYVAKNTVIYRVKKAEELLERGLDERPAETWAALMITQALCKSDPA